MKKKISEITIVTYGPEREDNNKNHFSIWMDVGLGKKVLKNSNKRVPLLFNDTMGGGKTYSITCKDGIIDLCLQHNPDIEAVVIDVPRVENMTDPGLLNGLTNLSWIIGRSVIPTNTIEEFKYRLNIAKMSSDENEKKSLVVLLNNTQYFVGGTSKKDDILIRMLKRFDLEDKVVLIQDEYHKGMNENSEVLKNNMGWVGPLGFVRYKMGRKFLKITPFVIGLSATPLSSMIEGNGKNYYIVPRLPKSKRVVRTSVIDHVNFFDFDTTESVTTNSGRENSIKQLENFVMDIFDKDTRLNYISNRYDLKIPIIKTAGLIKLNANHYERLGVKDLEDYMNRIDVNKDFNWAITTYEGIRVFHYNSVTKKSTEIDCVYENDQDLYNGMQDPDDNLRFLGVIEKGSLGINIKNLYGVISFRQPSTYDSNGNPVINNTVQLCGRPIRLKVLYEDLKSHSYLSKEECDKIWVEFNSCMYYFPDDNFYREVYNELRNCYYDKYEVYSVLKKMA